MDRPKQLPEFRTKYVGESSKRIYKCDTVGEFSGTLDNYIERVMLYAPYMEYCKQRRFVASQIVNGIEYGDVMYPVYTMN